MATKNFLFMVPVIKVWPVFLMLALVGCQSTRSRQAAPPPAVPGQPQVMNPEVTSPPPAPSDQKKVAVILGPGGAKAFAHIGVLKGLQRLRVPIHKVVGLEWGALVGGLYAVKGQLHEVEWKLYRMEQAGLPRPKGFFAKKVGDEPAKIMDPYLNEAFAKETINRSKVPFTCPSRSIWTGVVAWQNRGSYADAIRRCLSYPPVFKAQGTFLAGASQASEAIAQLRSEGYNVIILVNVLGSGMPVAQDSLPDNLNYVIMWQEVKRALVEAGKQGVDTVTVDTSNYPMVNFAPKKELISLGEAAGLKAGAALISKYGF